MQRRFLIAIVIIVVIAAVFYYARPTVLLAAGKSIQNGSTNLIMQTDSNLVVYVNGKAVWASGTHGATKLPTSMVLNNTGGFDIVDTSGKVLYKEPGNGSFLLWPTVKISGSGFSIVDAVSGRVSHMSGASPQAV